MSLMCEMLNKNNNNSNIISSNNNINHNIINGNKISEENKEDGRNFDKEKDINLINNDISFYKMNDNLYEENPFINPMKYPLDIKGTG